MLAVVSFHAGLGVTGGYVGVDVFFLVSGFLITSLIIKDIENGEFTFGNFWERRARRIMPAMFLVVVATLIAGWVAALPVPAIATPCTPPPHTHHGDGDTNAGRVGE